jgi:hypothetical protein
MCYFGCNANKELHVKRKTNMRTFYILGIILFTGCAKKDDCTPSSQSFTFQLNKAIDTSGNEVKAIDGSFHVFKFQYNYEQCEGIVGAPVSREIYFEVPATVQSSFSYAEESFQQVNAVVYLKAPINPSLRIKQIVSGVIHGTQINPTKWHITASVNSGSETINFDEDFIKAD